jgi:1-deoxy-D-xylulose 5-phosphate reductoisomerase
MIKKIMLLGLDTKKGKEAFDFFSKHTNKYRVNAISLIKQETSKEILEIIKHQKIQEILVTTESQKKYIEEEINSNLIVYTNQNLFIKKSYSDIVVVSTKNINTIKQILSAISEYKDLCFVNFDSLLHMGKIIFKDIKNKGVKFYPISPTLFSVKEILSDYKRPLLKEIGLVKTIPKTNDIKENNFSIFKKDIYSKYWIQEIYNMFLLSYMYDLPTTKFCFYEQNKPILSNIVSFLDGCNIINYVDQKKNIIYNHYFLSKEDLSKIDVDIHQNILNYTIKLTDYKNKKLLNLAIDCLNKNDLLPIVYYITLEHLIKKVYEKKISFKQLEEHLEEIIKNKSYHSNNYDLKTIIVLKKKIEKL